jgi:putative ATP-dependent endonuclease of OLD family
VNVPNELANIGLKVGTYKCFGDTPQGFGQILPFNLIVGRNNTGKSALLDLLAYIVTSQQTQVFGINGNAKVILSDILTLAEIQPLLGHWPSSKNDIGRRIAWSLERDGRQNLVAVDEDLDPPTDGALQALVNRKANPFQTYQFKRLSAERDIRPEDQAADSKQLGIDERGVGATATIHHFRSSTIRDNAIVETAMLRDLNMIFEPDAHFERIDTREHENHWEIYLDEKHKGRIPLSASGSGLKTIILVLAYVHLIPVLDGRSPATYLFGFEELENNLHPALQRRLLHFLRQTSERVGCRFFLTTHSPIEIDYFARDEHAQVLHVTHDGKEATVTTVSGYGHGRSILDDLDLRASDLLQANGIIWVEGPSDRIYLNKWIEMWTNGTCREGAHYQILLYGGKLLAHFDAEDPHTATDTIHLLTTNRNAAILIDSDKKSQDDRINTTKQRLITEIEDKNGFAWVTAGREIENYLPTELLTSHATLRATPGPYDHVTDVITSPRKLTDKVALAQAITPHLTREHLEQMSDLATQLPILVAYIKRWNGE